MEEKDKSPVKESEVLEDLPKLLTQLKKLIIAHNLSEVKASMDFLSIERRRDVIHSKELGQCLFFQACTAKAMDIIEYFIDDCMANVNEVGNVASLGKDNLTPLFISVRWCNIDLIHLLVEHGANIHWKDLEGRNAIVYACFLHRMEAAYTLKEYGANINSHKNQDLCAQDLAYLNRALKLGLNLDYRDDEGLTFLMKAAIKGNLDVIKAILKTKCNVYQRNYTCGAIALDLAVRLRQKDIINYFINNSVYSIADAVLSYEFCGAIEFLICKDMKNGSQMWDASIEIRKEHHDTIEASKKYYPALDNSSDIGSAEYCTDCTDCTLIAQWLICSLKVICRILGLNHHFVKTAFDLVAHCPDLGSEDYLTFERVRELCKVNSFSKMVNTNGVYLGLTAVSYMCKKQLKKCKRFPETIVPFIEKIAELLTDVINPCGENKILNTYIYHMYNHMLLMIVHLIEYALETECPGKNMLSKIISKAAKLNTNFWPSTLLLVAVERGFSFKTIVCLVAAGANVNAIDANQNTPLHLLAEQPIQLPNRRQIFRFLVNNGANLELSNDFCMKPRICLTAT